MKATHRTLLQNKRKPRRKEADDLRRSARDVYVHAAADAKNTLREIEVGSVAKEVSEPLRLLADRLERAPPIERLVQPERLLVQVAGAERTANVPLPGVTVRLHEAKDHVDQRTDGFGLALFAVEASTKELRVELLDSSGEALQTKSVSVPASGAAVELLIARCDGLDASFELGHQAKDARTAAAKELRALEKITAEAIAAAAHDIKTNLRALETLADRLAKTEDRK